MPEQNPGHFEDARDNQRQLTDLIYHSNIHAATTVELAAIMTQSLLIIAFGGNLSWLGLLWDVVLELLAYSSTDHLA